MTSQFRSSHWAARGFLPGSLEGGAKEWGGDSLPAFSPEEWGAFGLSIHAVPVLETSDSPWAPGWPVNRFCSVKESAFWRQQKVLEMASPCLLSPTSIMGRISCRVSCKLAMALHPFRPGRTPARLLPTCRPRRSPAQEFAPLVTQAFYKLICIHPDGCLG